MKSSLSKRKGAKAFAKLIVNNSNDKVLGAHFVGPEAAEIIQVPNCFHPIASARKNFGVSKLHSIF